MSKTSQPSGRSGAPEKDEDPRDVNDAARVEAVFRARLLAGANWLTTVLDREAMLEVANAPDLAGFFMAILPHMPGIGETEGQQ